MLPLAGGRQAIAASRTSGISHQSRCSRRTPDSIAEKSSKSPTRRPSRGLARLLRDLGDRRVEDKRDIAPVTLQPQDPRLDRGEVEQVADEAAESGTCSTSPRSS